MQPTLLLDVPGAPLRPLADGDVRFVGDPIVLIVAESRYVAEDAAELVEVDIEFETPVVDLEGALADGAPIVHPELGTNLAREMAFPIAPDLQALLDGEGDDVRSCAGRSDSTARPTCRWKRAGSSPSTTRPAASCTRG